MSDGTRKRRWYHLTPDRFFIGLLVVQVFLFVSERFQWLAFNEKKGWTVLITVGVVVGAVVVMLVWGLVGLCVRWRFQFGIRSLVVLLVAVSVPLGWFAWEMQRARKQRKAVAANSRSGELLRKRGLSPRHGWVDYDYQFDDKGNFLRGAQPPAPAWLRKLLGDDFFGEVIVEGMGGWSTDAELEHVQVFSRPKYLDISDSLVTDAGLKHVEGLTELEELCLANTEITDAGLEQVKGLKSLRVLSLEGTQVTDAGLEHLVDLTTLTELWLPRTQVTDRGITKLQEALPDCEIYHSSTYP